MPWTKIKRLSRPKVKKLQRTFLNLKLRCIESVEKISEVVFFYYPCVSKISSKSSSSAISPGKLVSVIVIKPLFNVCGHSLKKRNSIVVPNALLEWTLRSLRDHMSQQNRADFSTDNRQLTNQQTGTSRVPWWYSGEGHLSWSRTNHWQRDTSLWWTHS